MTHSGLSIRLKRIQYLFFPLSIEVLLIKKAKMKDSIVMSLTVLYTFYIVIPHLMRNPGLVFLDSCFRRNDALCWD